LIRKILHEPLLHFLVLGAALFALFNFSGNRSEPQDRRIVISSGRLDQAVTIFSRTWQRPPTAEEMRGLIEEEIRDEVLYREALAVGLEKDDVIVRRRLRQKFEFVTDDASIAPPSDSDLQAWLDRNPDRFRSDPKISFVQIYLNSGRRGEAARADADKIVAQLGNSGDSADILELGDATLLPREISAATPEYVANVFGDAFAQRLGSMEAGRWSGPVTSSYGLHVVYLRERVEAKPRALDEVRDDVGRAWLSERQREHAEETYRKLRARYFIVVESPMQDPAVPRPAADLKAPAQ
jgi:hypothetical protein